MKPQEKTVRRLTKAEQKRNEQFEQTRKQLKEKGYTEHDLTVGPVFANIMAIVLTLPFVVLFGVLFSSQHGSVSGTFRLLDLSISLAVLVVLIFAHELIHGVCWAAFSKHHWKSISFGFIARYCMPYCCCSEALQKWQYMVGGLIPTLVLGVLPAAVSIFTGSVFLLSIGEVMILGGGGDFIIILKLLFFRSHTDSLFIDHPYQCGVVAFTH